MTQLLLDSDAVIDVLKRFQSSIDFLAARVQMGDSLCTSDVVLGEIYAGLLPEDEEAAERFIAQLTFLPTSPAAAQQGGRWVYAYARQGRALKLADCLIAATSHEHGATLVTGNLRDFPMPEVPILPLPRTTRRGSS